MKYRTTLLLAVILGILLAAYAFLQFHEKEQARQVIAQKRLFQFTADAVQMLQLEEPGGTVVAAERGASGSWHFTEPDSTIVAFQPLWNRLAEKLSILMNERTVVEKPDSLEEWGLDIPALTVQFQVEKEKQPHRLSFGDFEPTQIHRYARLDDGPVILIQDLGYRELNRSLDELRYKFVVDDREAPLLYLEFSRYWTGREGGPKPGDPAPGTESVKVVLERENPESPWRMTAPVNAPADQNRAEALAMLLQFASGHSYIDSPESLSDYGLDPPHGRIRFRDRKDGSLQTLLLGLPDKTGKEESVFVKRDDQKAVFRMEATLLEMLPQQPDTFRERHLLTRPVTELQKIQCSTGGAAWELVRDGAGSWRLSSSMEENADPIAVSQFLSTLKGVKGESFPEGSIGDYGLAQPKTRFLLTFDSGEEAEIRLTPDRISSGFYAAMQDTGAIMMVPAGMAELLTMNGSDFLSRDLLRFPRKQAEEVTFTLDGRQYRFHRAHERWVLEAPEALRLASQSDIGMVLDILNPLTATSIEKARDSVVTGLDAPVLEVVIQLVPEAAEAEHPPGTLKVGASVPEDSSQRYAMVTGRDEIFRISGEVVDSVRELIRGLETR